MPVSPDVKEGRIYDPDEYLVPMLKKDMGLEPLEERLQNYLQGEWEQVCILSVSPELNAENCSVLVGSKTQRVHSSGSIGPYEISTCRIRT